MNTSGKQGLVGEQAKVYTNEPKRPYFSVGMKVFVKVPIMLSPRYLSMRGEAGKVFTKTVEVSSGLDKPLTLTPDRYTLADKLNYTIKEVDAGKKFVISFESIPGPEDRYKGYLTLKTNFPEKPEVTIRIRGLIKNLK